MDFQSKKIFEILPSAPTANLREVIDETYQKLYRTCYLRSDSISVAALFPFCRICTIGIYGTNDTKGKLYCWHSVRE